MERINGFIDLDTILKKNFEELVNKGTVTDITSGLKKKRCIIDIGKYNYFFKECEYKEAITELIVSQMLDFAEIPNVKYDLAVLDGHYGVISNDFKKDGYNYFSGAEILEDYTKQLSIDLLRTENKEFRDALVEEHEKIYSAYTNNNFELIWHAMESHYKNNPGRYKIVSKLMQQLAYQHLTDIVILNQDKNSTNWVIEEKDDKVNLVNPFDHGEALKDCNYSSLRVEPIGQDSDENNFDTDIYTELERFLNRSDNRNYRIFLDLKKKLGVSNLKLSIAKVEERIGVPIDEGVKEEMIATYEGHHKKLNDVLRKTKFFDEDEYDRKE